jgi:hypothetical protein
MSMRVINVLLKVLCVMERSGNFRKDLKKDILEAVSRFRIILLMYKQTQKLRQQHIKN